MQRALIRALTFGPHRDEGCSGLHRYGSYPSTYTAAVSLARCRRIASAVGTGIRLKREVVVNRHRCVVGEALLLVDVFGACQRRDGGCCQVVVQPPTHVVGVGLAAIAPPGVGGVCRGGL